ncbi:MAG: HEPN domain-containing protein [Myxococcota bacterium]
MQSAVDRAVDVVARRLAAALGPRLERVALFGSRARGDWHEESDADLLVLTPDFETANAALHEAVAEALSATGVYVSAIVLSREAFERSALAQPVARDAVDAALGATRRVRMDEALRERIGAHLREAEAKLAGATHALGGGFCDDAVSRAYYAMFHAARALLLPRHVEPKTHVGLIVSVHRHLVDPGLLEHEHGSRLGDAERLRIHGDYGAEVEISEATARRVAEDASAFVGRAREILTTEGWLAKRSE